MNQKIQTAIPTYEELEQRLAEAQAMLGRFNNLKPAGVFRGQEMKVNGDVRYVEVEWLKSVQPNAIIYSEPAPIDHPFESAVGGLRYNLPEACGEVAAIHIGGKRYPVTSEQTEQDAADAARYRWMRANGGSLSKESSAILDDGMKVVAVCRFWCSTEELDCLIDEKLKNEEEKEIN